MITQEVYSAIIPHLQQKQNDFAKQILLFEALLKSREFSNDPLQQFIP